MRLPSDTEGSHTDWDDPTLIHSCLARSEGAWEEFLSRYSDLIYSCIRRYSLPEEEIQETYQVTVATIVTSLQNLRNPDRLSSWIIGIAVRQGAKRVQQLTRESATDPAGEVFERGGESSDGSYGFELSDAQRVSLERAQQLKTAMRSLTERCRGILGALYLEDPPLTYEEVAERESISSGSVGPTRRRCLDGLKRFFEKSGWLDPPESS